MFEIGNIGSATSKEVDQARGLHMVMRPGGHPPRDTPGKSVKWTYRTKLLYFDPGLRRLCSINAHPRLFDKAEKLLHVRTPVIHDVLRAALVAEVHDACWPVDARPHRASHDESTERFLRLLGCEVEKGRQARECNAGIIFCDDSDILMCASDENKANSREPKKHTCSITRVCRSSQCLSFVKTSVLRKNGPKTSTMPGHRMSSSVVKDLIKLLCRKDELEYGPHFVENALLQLQLFER